MDISFWFVWIPQAAIQLQDKNMHKQLLAMRSSICDLKDELKNERERWEIETKERWEMETQLDERERDLAPAPGYVRVVETIKNKNHREELRINHAKQDSGILSDEEGSEEEEKNEESVSQLLKTFPPAVNPRSSSFFATARRSNSYLGHLIKPSESEGKENSERRSGNVFRARARSLAGTDTERLSSATFSWRRSHTLSEGAVSRFGSMPVINEMPSDAFQRNTSRTKTFAVYGCRRSEGVDDHPRQSSFSASLPAFGSLTRHSSMPVMYKGGRPRSGDEFRSTKENRIAINNKQPVIKRSTSQIFLSRPAFEKTVKENAASKDMYRMYRSTSQISLV